MLQGVHASQLEGIWNIVTPMIEAAIEKSQKDFWLEDVLVRLINRDMQLWVWYEEGAIVACCITQLVNYPRSRVCQMPFIGGKAMRKWLTKDVENIVVAWARERGCSQLEGFCRDGWLRLLPHWRKVWTTMRRSV